MGHKDVAALPDPSSAATRRWSRLQAATRCHGIPCGLGCQVPPAAVKGPVCVAASSLSCISFHHVTAGHLQGYVDEYAFRYSHRKDQTPMFWTMLGRVVRQTS